MASLADSLADYVQDAFQILEEKSSKLTRRSAGIPAIMACVLIPSTLEEFNGVIETLAALAMSKTPSCNTMTNEYQSRLPQVHALNCLRELFTNSKLRERTVTWLIKVLDIAASSLSSKIWAIRNCGLMLFRACASRVGNAADVSDFETCEVTLPGQSEAVLRISFKLLSRGQQINLHYPELVFAGLDLMSRITIPGDLRCLAKEHILLQLGSPFWMIREHAARVYASQLRETDALAAIIPLISSMALNDQNKSHGILLCSRELLRKYITASLPFPDAELLALEVLLERQAPNIRGYAAPVQSAFLFLMNDYIALRPERWCIKRLHWTYRSEPLASPGPFESQLRSSSAFNSYLIGLAASSETVQTLYRTFQDVAVCDLDAGSALVKAIQDHGSSSQHNLHLLVYFYMRVVLDMYDESITAAAMFGLSSCLENIQEDQDLLITQKDLEVLTNSFVGMPYSGCRDLFNARIRGLGNILAYRLKERESVWEQQLFEPLSLWIEMLSSAAKDSTQQLTRLNAAKSLHCFRLCLLHGCDKAGAKGKLVLCSILYDFLNDDDQEIRHVAASTTSFVLSSAAAGGVRLQLSPTAASLAFSCYVVNIFKSKNEFSQMALSRLLLSSPINPDDMNGFAALASRHSVKKQLDTAREESHGLFEEERQNLYLDEIREIEIWYAALSKVSSVGLDADVRALLGQWALEGLCELRTALPSLTSGIFGILWKREMVTLFMRVIRVAELMLRWDQPYISGIWKDCYALHKVIQCIRRCKQRLKTLFEMVSLALSH